MYIQFLFYFLYHSLGDLADLIFVFFDPIGQALCKRTMNLVEKLNEKHADRVKFYLTKADEAGHESDRQVSWTLPSPLFTARRMVNYNTSVERHKAVICVLVYLRTSKLYA